MEILYNAKLSYFDYICRGTQQGGPAGAGGKVDSALWKIGRISKKQKMGKSLREG